MKQYHKNPRQITGRQFEQLGEWLYELGDLSGIVHDLNSDEIVGGNQRGRVFDINNCEIVIEHELEEPDRHGSVAFGYVLWEGGRYAYRAVRWTPEQCEKANIVANKAGGEWDFDILANEFDVGELLEWGFEDFELGIDEDALNGDGADAESQVDRASELQEEWQTATGQIWQLGRHRLACGDCTDAATVERVLDGAKPLLMVTDPPYGVEYDPHWRDDIVGEFGQSAARGDGATNDDIVDWSTAYGLFPGDVAYVWHASWHTSEVQASLESADYEIRYQIVWAKQHFAISRGHYHWMHEPCWYAVRKGRTAHWCGDRTQSTLWDIQSLNPAGRQEERQAHGTQKPLECMERPIRNHEGDVYEPFCGSGTTIIAAENQGRTCYAIEIEAKYVAVALERFYRAFDIKPELIR